MFNDSTYNESGDNEVDGASFLLAMSKLRAVMLHDNEDASEFFFSLFLDSTADKESGIITAGDELV